MQGMHFPLDVDKDRIEELVICISDYVFIVKFKGTVKNHSYGIYYMTKNNITGNYFGVTMYDLDGDGYEELLIHRDRIRSSGGSKHVTHIYKPEISVSNFDQKMSKVSGFYLKQNYPNPFNPTTKISYSLAQDADVTLSVYDMLGRKVAELVNETQPAGIYNVNFVAESTAGGLSSGVYIYRITANSNGRILFSDTKQMLLMK